MKIIKFRAWIAKNKTMNKNTLELKHLAPYLPYEVNVLCRKQIYTLMPANFCAYNWNFDKLILHPLSDLTKEIEVSGERFVPYEKLYADCCTDTEREFFEILEDDVSRISNIVLFASYTTVEKLISMHFDVFGLIEAGFAVDINTLE